MVWYAERNKQKKGAWSWTLRVPQACGAHWYLLIRSFGGNAYASSTGEGQIGVAPFRNGLEVPVTTPCDSESCMSKVCSHRRGSTSVSVRSSKMLWEGTAAVRREWKARVTWSFLDQISPPVSFG